MNGPEHYAEAERLLGSLPEMQVGADTVARIALAQVHATLAVAASNVIYNTTSDNTGWMEILGVSAQDWSPRFSLCALCQKPAKRWVSYISRTTRRVTKRQPLCDDHVEQELELATSGLSMVDIDIQPYP